MPSRVVSVTCPLCGKTQTTPMTMMTTDEKIVGWIGHCPTVDCKGVLAIRAKDAYDVDDK